MSEDIYQFPFPVYVAEKYVTPGTSIENGKPIIKITSPEIVTMISNYNEAVRNSDNYSDDKTLSVQKQKEILEIKLVQNNEKMSEVQKQINATDAAWKSNSAKLEFEKDDAENKLGKNKELYAGKYISAQELKEYELRKVTAADMLVAGKQKYEKERMALISESRQYSLDRTSLNNELEKLKFDSKFDSVRYQDQDLLAYNKIKSTFGSFEISDGCLILKSKAPGVVSFVFEGEKEVAGSSVLLKVLYRKSSLYGFITSPPTLIGKLEKRQNVHLKVATFPYYEWGAADGHLDNISLAADEKGNFNVTIALDDTKKMKGRLQPGLTGIATIVLSERTFFDYFFRKVKRTWYNSTTLTNDE